MRVRAPKEVGEFDERSIADGAEELADEVLGQSVDRGAKRGAAGLHGAFVVARIWPPSTGWSLRQSVLRTGTRDV